MRILFRPGTSDDFEYCANLYFTEMHRTIRELGLNLAAHARRFRDQWDFHQVRIITLDGNDVGWLQRMTQGDALFIAQLFVETGFQRQGIGTEVMNRMLIEARTEGRAITLGVVKSNPARRLYERLGFRITHEDNRKFYMKREPNDVA